jgi:hypothetical protein
MVRLHCKYYATRDLAYMVILLVRSSLDNGAFALKSLYHYRPYLYGDYASTKPLFRDCLWCVCIETIIPLGTLLIW